MRRFRSGVAILVGGTVLVSSFVRADEPTTAAPVAPLAGSTGPRAETGAPFGPFLVYPDLMLGGVYNDNLFPGSATRQAAFGSRIAPSLIAIDDDGLRKTSLYFSADADLYPGAGATIPVVDKYAVSLSARAQQNWTPTPDLALQADAGYVRQNGVLQTPIVAANGFAASPSALNLTEGAQFSDNIEAHASIEKTFGHGFFVRAGVGVDTIVYETGAASSSTAARSQDLSGALRVGYGLTPGVSGFVEGDLDQQSHGGSAEGADVYRAVAGLSFNLAGFVDGQIYGGYQRQISARGAFAAVSTPTFGGRISYDPTPYLTISASLDQTIGFAAGLVSSPAAGNPDITQARIEADYALTAYGRAAVSISRAQTSVMAPATSRVVAWVANASFDYNFWRSLEVTLAYQFSALDADGGTLRSYNQNMTTLGLTYKY